MGITMKSPNHTISLGYGGFNMLRMKVAELSGKDIFEHYRYLMDNMFIMSYGDFNNYDEKTELLSEKYQEKMNGILEFLYACDAYGSVSVSVCKDIYTIVQDYDDDIIYGYPGRENPIKFKDFKEILNDCIMYDSELQWS